MKMKKAISIVATLGLLIVLAAVLVEYHTGTLPGEIDRLQSEGEDMIQKVEKFKADQGSYPASLDDAGVTDLSTRFGDWEYKVYTNGFRLSVGDYSHAFILGYDSSTGWWKDT